MPKKSTPKKTVKKTVKKSVNKAVKKPIKRTLAKKAKKTVKKKIKPASKKKAVGKMRTFKALVCASTGECFWSRDGRILENLSDLHLAIGSMDDEVFMHHIGQGKNDFAEWVEHILMDEECAHDLRKTKKRSQAEKVLAQHLRSYLV